jgi:hypothetical protein
MSEARRPGSEFLGLHDPWAEPPPGEAPPRPPRGPLLDREQVSELLRAGASLGVLCLLMIVAIAALS